MFCWVLQTVPIFLTGMQCTVYIYSSRNIDTVCMYLDLINYLRVQLVSLNYLRVQLVSFNYLRV